MLLVSQGLGLLPEYLYSPYVYVVLIVLCSEEYIDPDKIYI
jgi:hypothetical protein